jgi:hypothetical protein
LAPAGWHGPLQGFQAANLANSLAAVVGMCWLVERIGN